MRPINVEFVNKASLPKWVWSLGCVAAACAVTLQGAFAWRSLEALNAAQETERTMVAQLVQLQSTLQITAPRRQIAPSYQNDAERTAKLATFPLNNVLTAIEALNQPEVKVIGLEVMAAEASVRIALEVNDNDGTLRALSQLNQGEQVPLWSPSSGSPATQGNGAGRATLVSIWPMLRH